MTVATVIEELNEMLDDAKLKLSALQQYRESDNQDASQRKLLYMANSQAWVNLRNKLDKVAPVAFIGRDETKRIIGTAGLVAHDLMLSYSPDKNNRYTMHGYRLSTVEKFLKAQE